MIPHHGDVAVPRLEEPDERLGDAAAPEDRDAPVEQVAAAWTRPLGGPRVPADVAEPRDAERQGHLGDGFGVHALAAGPDAVVIEVVDEVLDAGERQLHPADVIGVVERLAQRIDRTGIGPHDPFGLVGADEFTATGNHRVGEPVRSAGRAEMDSGCVGVRHLATTVVVAAPAPVDRA